MPLEMRRAEKKVEGEKKGSGAFHSALVWEKVGVECTWH